MSAFTGAGVTVGGVPGGGVPVGVVPVGVDVELEVEDRDERREPVKADFWVQAATNAKTDDNAIKRK